MKRAASATISGISSLFRAIFLAPILFYRRVISPGLPRRCKYEPTCSAYAEQAIRELGVIRGTLLAAWRVVRCNPFSHGGIDDVADRRFFRPASNEPDELHESHDHHHAKLST